MGDRRGVIIREKSLALFFVFEGERHRKTLRVGGKPMPPTPANIKFADRTADDIRRRIEAGTFVMEEFFPDDPSATVGVGKTAGAQLDAWLAAQRIEDSTRRAYGSAVRFWQAAPVAESGARFGDLPIRSVRHSHVLTALASRSKISGKTINNYVSVLREAMQMAVHDKVLRENPVQAIDKAPHQKPPPDPFDEVEREAILAHMRAHCDEQEYAYCAFKFFTGLRSGEAIALRWQDVDLQKREILVHESVVLGKRKSTKTGVARVVRLNSRALEALELQKKHTFAAADAVFHDPLHNEAWARERNFTQRCWVPCLKALGIRWRPTYNTRHTYATQMLMAGVNAARAARWMGHSRQVFDSTYTRWLDGARDDYEIEKLEASMRVAAAPQKSQV